MGTRKNRLAEEKYEKYQNFYLKTSSFLVVKFSIYLNRRVFVMMSVGPNTYGKSGMKTIDVLSTGNDSKAL